VSVWPSTRPKRVLAALLRIGWVQKRQAGSHRTLAQHIYLPTWLADRIFPICGTLFGIALALIGVRLLR
jgi:hypothetical protein